MQIGNIVAQNGRTKKQIKAYKEANPHVCLGSWCLFHAEASK